MEAYCCVILNLLCIHGQKKIILGLRNDANSQFKDFTVQKSCFLFNSLLNQDSYVVLGEKVA